MGITITKHKQAEKKETQQLDMVDVGTLDIDALADRYGSLEDKVNALKHNPVFAQFEEAKKELYKRLNEVEPTDEVEIKGHHWLLEVGAAAKNPRKLKDGAIEKLIAMLGIEAFAAIAKVNITDIEKYCTPEQAAVVIEEDTGYNLNKRNITSQFLG